MIKRMIVLNQVLKNVRTPFHLVLSDTPYHRRSQKLISTWWSNWKKDMRLPTATCTQYYQPMKFRDMNIWATFLTTFSAYEMIAKGFKCYVSLLTKLTINYACVLDTSLNNYHALKKNWASYRFIVLLYYKYCHHIRLMVSKYDQEDDCLKLSP